MKHAFNFVSKKSIFHQIQLNKKSNKNFSLIPEKRKKLKRALLNLFLLLKFAQKGSLDFYLYSDIYDYWIGHDIFECMYMGRETFILARSSHKFIISKYQHILLRKHVLVCLCVSHFFFFGSK